MSTQEFDPIDGWELIGQGANAENSIVVRTTDTETIFLCRVITWDGVATPVVHLEEARTIKNPIDDEAMKNIKNELLNLDEYFRICTNCHSRTYAGYCMGDEAYCMACAQHERHIVF